MVETIYWPDKVDEAPGELLEAIHRNIDLDVRSYSNQGFKDASFDDVIEFLMHHEGPKEFVYLASKTHVVAAMYRNRKFGWIERDAKGYVTAIFHAFDGTFRKVWCPNISRYDFELALSGVH